MRHGHIWPLVNSARRCSGNSAELLGGLHTFAAVETVLRYDVAAGTLGATKRTPQGGLVAEARLTRVGVFSYVQPDGSIVRELRPPDEVFDPASLETLAHAPLTDGHPDRVTPENWQAVTIGHVAGAAKRDGSFVAAPLHIQHGPAIQKADAGKLVELSCGYETRLDRTPGEWEGQRYDAVQRQIRYNHVAAGPAGWGRAGPEVRLRLDSGYAVSGAESAAYVPAMTEAVSRSSDPSPGPKSVDPARVDAKPAADEIETLRAQNRMLALQLEKANARADEAAQQARLDVAVEERATLLDEARSVLGRGDAKAFSGKGLTNAQIKRSVIAALEPAMATDGLPDSALDAVYTLALMHSRKADAALASARQALPREDKRKGSDDDDEMSDDVQKASDAMVEKQKNAWKKPLAKARS